MSIRKTRASAWFSLCCLLAAFTGSAANWYVDANNGKDDDAAYDGSAPDKAKKTLAAAMAIDGLASGDTVWAAEGDYNDGEMKQSASAVLAARVVVPDGVRLEASGRQSATFITGRAASGDGVEHATLGLGTNALRCVYLSGAARIRGFTIRNGRSCNNTAKDGTTHAAVDYTGGAILGQTTKHMYVEDCVITDCNAYARQVQGYQTHFINCQFLSCRNRETGGNIADKGYFCNCYFDHLRGGRVTMYANAMLNCTIGPDNCQLEPNQSYKVDPYWGVSSSGYDYHNALMLLTGTSNGGKQVDCLNDNTVKEVHTVHGETHVTFMKRADMGLDTDYSPKTANSAATDYCTTDTFATKYKAWFPDATKKWYEVTDLKGNPRISNGILDAGCYEFDWRPTFSKDLAALRVSVTNATWNVTETAEKRVSLGAGSADETYATMDIAWTAPSASEAEYSFLAQVTGTGTLKVYADGAAEPFATATAADGTKSITLNKTGDLGLRLVYEGEDGAAEVWSFQDSFYANISIPDKGLAVSGDLTGPGNYVLTGPTTFTLTRTFDSTHLCTGFTTNHVYVSWDDLPGGAFTWTVSNKATSIEIEAVYMEHQTWYVDDANGNDANTGFLPDQAKKTLIGASTNGVITTGDTIMVLPGTYDEGEMIRPGSTQTIANRVFVPEGVRLVSRDGASVTHIVGKASPNPTYSAYKLGPGAVRCVYLGAGASVEGFTIREGHTDYNGNSTASTDYYYGAVVSGTGAWIVDCVVSNCYASWRSITGGGSGVRSKFVACKGVNYDACINGGSWYNCYFGNLTGSYGIYDHTALVNCTLGVSEAGIRYPGDGRSPCWNCLILGSIHQGGTFHRCVISKESYDKRGGGVAFDADCLTTLTLAQLQLDAANDYKPKAGSPALDFGNNDYLAMIPEKYRTSAYPEGQRVYNGAVDAGCHEYDIRPDMTKAISDGQAVVEAVTAGVTNEAGAVTIPAGEEMDLAWAPSALATTRFAFQVAFTGTGTLKGYADGATEPSFTATESGLVTYDRAGSTPLKLRLVVEGDGAAARVSSFSNVDAAYILPSDGGIAVTGANLGTNLVAVGSPLTFTIRRAYDSTRLSSGFTVNGVAYSWDDYPNGWTHTVDAADRSTTVLIGATYLAAGEQGWYVDAVNGNDANHGLAPENAKKTLSDACTNTPVVAGETIWLMPGAYDRGVIMRGTAKTGNRGVLPSGVNLASTSGNADDTFVVGAPTPVEQRVADNGECGLGCVRCLTVLGNNVISNVTICGGRAWTEKFQKDKGQREYYAAINGSVVVVGCVISNNMADVAVIAGNSTFYRTRICENRARWYTHIENSSLYNCLHYNNTGAYPLLDPYDVVNTTLGPNSEGSCWARSAGARFYNTLWFGAIGSGIAQAEFRRTYFVDVNIATSAVKVWADGSKTNAQLTAVHLDATKTPIKGECEAMEAANADYLSLYPAKFRQEALVDFYGNPRNLGGGMDIGAVEYDWRKDFAKDLAGRLLVPMATSNVVETADKAVRLTDGQELTVAFENAAKAEVGRVFPVTIEGGTLTITVNGTVAATLTESGDWTYRHGAADDRIVFSFAASADGGYADILRTKGTKGLMLLVR